MKMTGLSLISTGGPNRVQRNGSRILSQKKELYKLLLFTGMMTNLGVVVEFRKTGIFNIGIMKIIGKMLSMPIIILP
jgi:hypothetical protein